MSVQLRKFDVGVIVAIILACLGGVYKFAKLEGRVDALNPDVVETEIDSALQRIKAEGGANRIPVGTIVPFAGTANVAPQGWLLCDGSPVPAGTQYDRLRDVLAAADWDRPQSEVSLPDMRGRFLRGLDHPKGRDAAGRDKDGKSRAVGSVQSASTGVHNHGAGDLVAQINPSRGEVPLNVTGSRWTATGCLKGIKQGSPDGGNEHQTTAVVVAGGTSAAAAFAKEENHPENCAVNWIIKY